MKLYEPVAALLLTVLLLAGFWYGISGDARHDATEIQLDLTTQKISERLNRVQDGAKDGVEALGRRVYRIESHIMHRPTDTFIDETGEEKTK